MKIVKICKIGHFNHSINISNLEKHKSKYFKIIDTETVTCIDVDHFKDQYIYPNEKICHDIGNDETDVDVKVAIIDQPLEGNFYMHRLDDRKVVISIFPIIDVLRENKIPLENYILRCIYEVVLFLYENSFNSQVSNIPHHETRCCLFDKNVFTDRIIYSCVKPIICDKCKSRLEKKNLPKNFVKDIEKELKKLNKTLYYRIEDRVKKNPILYIFLTALSACVINIVSNIAYDFFFK